MTTIALLRADVNIRLDRQDGDPEPWEDDEIDSHVAAALRRLWPDLGLATYGETETDGGQFLAVPSTFTGGEYKISRIILLDAPAAGGGRYSDDIKGWKKHPGDKVVVKSGFPRAGVYAGFTGYVPFSVAGTNLPTSLFDAVCDRAASFAFGAYAAKLANLERQQNLDSGRVIDYPTAIGAAAYFARLYADATLDSQYRLTFAPRSSSRSR